MGINMMCMNSKCEHYWEDNCMRNINEERIEIDENGICQTFKIGLNPIYEIENKLNMTLEELAPTVRTYNCLKRAGIDTVRDLVGRKHNELCIIRNMSSKCVEEVEGLLAGLGLKLMEEEING